jgi:hypothetical protein
MIPVGIASAFFNNTPLVAIMIPIVQSWAKKIGVSDSQLLIHLSFASILGGTITIIGTSTNLVVVGLLGERYPNEHADDVTVNLFDLAIYGVPVMLMGFAYMVIFSPILLPNEGGSGNGGGADSILVSARVLRWSPACDNTVADSGLRGLPGLFLVTVHKRSTGATIRAVGPDLILQEGDRLDFTGVVESFGRVCEEYALEPITNETEQEHELLPLALDAAGIEMSAPLVLPSTRVPAAAPEAKSWDDDWGLLGVGDEERQSEKSVEMRATLLKNSLPLHMSQQTATTTTRQTADVLERLRKIQMLHDVIRNESSTETGSGSVSGRDTPNAPDGAGVKPGLAFSPTLGPASWSSAVMGRLRTEFTSSAAEEPPSPDPCHTPPIDTSASMPRHGIKNKIRRAKGDPPLARCSILSRPRRLWSHPTRRRARKMWCLSGSTLLTARLFYTTFQKA